MARLSLVASVLMWANPALAKSSVSETNNADTYPMNPVQAQSSGMMMPTYNTNQQQQSTQYGSQYGNNNALQPSVYVPSSLGSSSPNSFQFNGKSSLSPNPLLSTSSPNLFGSAFDISKYGASGVVDTSNSFGLNSLNDLGLGGFDRTQDLLQPLSPLHGEIGDSLSNEASVIAKEQDELSTMYQKVTKQKQLIAEADAQIKKMIDMQTMNKNILRNNQKAVKEFSLKLVGKVNAYTDSLSMGASTGLPGNQMINSPPVATAAEDEENEQKKEEGGEEGEKEGGEGGEQER